MRGQEEARPNEGDIAKRSPEGLLMQSAGRLKEQPRVTESQLSHQFQINLRDLIITVPGDLDGPCSAPKWKHLLDRFIISVCQDFPSAVGRFRAVQFHRLSRSFKAWCS